MLRRLVNLLCCLSLLLCLASAALWWRSWRHANLDEDRYSWLTSRGDRCTIRSDAGTVTLFEPPAGNPNAVARLPLSAPAPRNALEERPGSIFPPPYRDPAFRIDRLLARNASPTAREAAAAIHNDQLLWVPDLSMVFVSSAAPVDPTPYAWCWTRAGSAAFLFGIHDVREEGLDKSWFPSMQQVPAAFSSADAIAVLLPALEDPNRFAAAHYLLMNLPPRVATRRDTYRIPNQTATIDGLRVQIPWPGELDPMDRLFDLPSSYDASQLPMIRDQWHRQLDVAALSAPWWSLVAATGAPPLLQVIRAIRRRRLYWRRARSGCCVACGYDLRDSSDCCPECGVRLPAR